MAITEADIKLFASQRLTDNADGGGRATSVVVQDGVKNNLFPDLGSVARSVGALHLRKAFMHVTSGNADTLFDAHVILDDTPDDPATSALLLPATGATDERAALIAAVGAQGDDYPFRGTVGLAEAAASGAREVRVVSTRVPFVPLAKTSAPQTDVAAAVREVQGYAPVPGATRSLEFSSVAVTGGFRLRALITGLATWLDFAAPDYSTISGSCQINGQAHTFSYDGVNVVLTGPSGVFVFSQPDTLGGVEVVTPTATSAVTATCGVLLRVNLPQQSQRIQVTAQNQSFVYSIALPAGTVAGTETVTVTNSTAASGVPQTYRCRWASSSLRRTFANATTGDWNISSDSFETSPSLQSFLTGNVNRATGEMTLTLTKTPDVGSEIVVTYAAGGAAQNLAAASLSNGGTFTANKVTATLPANHRLAGLLFSIPAGGANPWTLQDLQTGGGASVNVATGEITVPALNGQTISTWYAFTVPKTAGVSNVTLELPAALEASSLVVSGTTTAGAAFVAAANASGQFGTAQVQGFYSAATGRAALSFTSPARYGELTWTGEQAAYSPSGFDLGGLNLANLPSDGRVTVIRPNDLVVVHDTQRLAAQTVTGAQTVSTGRTNLSRIRVVGNNGTVHAVLKAGSLVNGGATADLTAGSVTFTSTAGYSQPVQIEHRIEAMSSVSSVREDGTLVLTAALPRAFPSTSRVSSSIVAGDLSARVGQPFAQNTWTNAWSDTVIGLPPAADYQHAAFPIAATNPGGVTDRWAIIFTTNTAFRIVGENSGEIFGTWGTASNAAPTNPVTNTPFFTILSAGWGGGWAQGNVLRFNTAGASSPLWVARCTQPSNPFDGADSLTISMRGEANA